MSYVCHSCSTVDVLLAAIRITGTNPIGRADNFRLARHSPVTATDSERVVPTSVFSHHEMLERWPKRARITSYRNLLKFC